MDKSSDDLEKRSLCEVVAGAGDEGQLSVRRLRLRSFCPVIGSSMKFCSVPLQMFAISYVAMLCCHVCC